MIGTIAIEYSLNIKASIAINTLKILINNFKSIFGFLTTKLNKSFIVIKTINRRVKSATLLNKLTLPIRLSIPTTISIKPINK